MLHSLIWGLAKHGARLGVLTLTCFLRCVSRECSFSLSISAGSAAVEMVGQEHEETRDERQGAQGVLPRHHAVQGDHQGTTYWRFVCHKERVDITQAKR